VIQWRQQVAGTFPSFAWHNEIDRRTQRSASFRISRRVTHVSPSQRLVSWRPPSGGCNPATDEAGVQPVSALPDTFPCTVLHVPNQRKDPLES
jgi:hypothetical protein